MTKDEVLQLEKELSFDSFSNEDAYNIAVKADVKILNIAGIKFPI